MDMRYFKVIILILSLVMILSGCDILNPQPPREFKDAANFFPNRIGAIWIYYKASGSSAQPSTNPYAEYTSSSSIGRETWTLRQFNHVTEDSAYCSISILCVDTVETSTSRFVFPPGERRTENRRNIYSQRDTVVVGFSRTKITFDFKGNLHSPLEGYWDNDWTNNPPSANTLYNKVGVNNKVGVDTRYNRVGVEKGVGYRGGSYISNRYNWSSYFLESFAP